MKAPVLITFCLHDILSSAEERYKKASSFTRKVNLFDKDFIFIPVCRRCVRESCLFYRIFFCIILIENVMVDLIGPLGTNISSFFKTIPMRTTRHLVNLVC